MADFNHFDFVPATVNRKRSTFKFRKRVSTSAYVGFLYPMCRPIDMQPGSSLDINNFAAEIMSGALIRPLFDEFYLDVFAFNVPNRIVWEHWKQYLGSTDDVLYTNLQTYGKPYINYAITPTKNGFQINQLLANCFELPIVQRAQSGNGSPVVKYFKIDALPFRGYTFIWNQYFRPEQLVSPVLFSKGDRGNAGDNIAANYSNSAWQFTIGGQLVYIPAPGTVSGNNADTVTDGGVVLPVYRVAKSLWTSCLPKPSLETMNLLSSVAGFPEATSLQIDAANGDINYVNGSDADWSNVVLTVNNYRETIMLQNYYDCLNRAGSRYQEIMYNIFGTRPKDAVIDIPELIIHKRFTIFRNKVVSTAETLNSNDGTVNPVGSQHANFDTVVKDSLFRFTTFEHSYIHIMYCVRSAVITMADGVEPAWKRLSKFDEYYPQFDGMGDVPRYMYEVYTGLNLFGGSSLNDVLGYQEYGAEWKSQRNSATGWLNPNCPSYIPGYTMAEKQAIDLPLSGDLSYCSCINETIAFAECLAISSPIVAPQLICHFRLEGTITHPMPVYNIPGNGALL